ncbi:ATP-binding cassette domain-containing protein [Stappia sp. GBMRC 2046]|uniref:ATP-binding cassette domain-containing protein n=1 Tax=Stappia sediminis TaxID=2692190 RepID=A0A7X3LTT5_9HYPH|nr:ABC transporter ATP-binding protein [Stappia sediminis]MXN64915.1 ATP-binding cassette domain-containing protein [Stappia sediminis]
MFLSLRGVTRRFGSVLAVDHVDLDLSEGEFVCFLGPSGCGKTTLLRLVAGLEILDEGEILLEETDLSGLPARKRNFGVVFQSYSLFPNLTVARNIAYGLECRKWAKAKIEARVGEMLDLVHLGQHAEKHPHELSGGMQQRVALARALAPEPSVLLLDEPLSALDAKVRESLRGEISELQRRLGITTIMVTHDQDEAMEMADRIVAMNRGRIEQVGSAEELYWEPATRFVGEFIGRINVLSASELRAGFDGPPGETALAIRPEHVVLSEDGAHSGTVRKVAFLGNTMRLGVEAGGQEIEIEVHGRRRRMNVGDTVTFDLPADRVRRLAVSSR